VALVVVLGCVALVFGWVCCGAGLLLVVRCVPGFFGRCLSRGVGLCGVGLGSVAPVSSFRKEFTG